MELELHEKPESASIKVISSMATSRILSELFAQFEKQSGQKTRLEAVGGVTAEDRVRRGEDFDLVVLASNAIDRLTTEGRVVQGSRVDLVKSGVAVAVRKGARTFDISNEEAVKKAVSTVNSLSYSTGPSGVYLSELFKRWGIFGQIEDRIVVPPPGTPVASLVAKGEVELGFQQLSELIHAEGIIVLGPLPADIQIPTIFSAGIAKNTKQQEAVKKLLQFLAAPETADIKRKNGMEPFQPIN